MSKPLTYRCRRRSHRIAVVRLVDGRLRVEAEQLVTSLEDRAAWTPASWWLEEYHSRRVGCACGETYFLTRSDMLARVARGERTALL